MPQADSVVVVRAARRQQRRQILSFGGGHLQGMPVLSEAAFGDKYVRKVALFLTTKRS